MQPISCVRVGNVNDEMLVMTSRYLNGMFGMSVDVGSPSEDPEYARDVKREQYSSTLILKRLSEQQNDHAIRLLALTEKDLFIPMLTFVFGQAQLSRPPDPAFQATKVAIVSLARLRPEFYGLPSDRELTVQRARKEIAHEMGHTLGLVHCDDRRCIMSLSTEIFEVDMKSQDFCRDCWLLLQTNLSIIKEDRKEYKDPELRK